MSYIRISYGLKNEFELAMVNEPLVFEQLRFECSVCYTSSCIETLQQMEEYHSVVK